MKPSPLFLTRRAGVLLHPTSIPNAHSFFQEKPYPQMHGTLGKDAYLFVDFLALSGVSVWQMLPTTPTHADLSPYQSVSAHAGNPELISIDALVHQGWVDHHDEWLSMSPTSDNLHKIRLTCAKQFYTRVQESASLAEKLNEFCAQNNYWLDDFVLFMALRNHFQHRASPAFIFSLAA